MRQRLVTKILPRLSTEQCADYRHAGYLVIPRLIEQDNVAVLAAACDGLEDKARTMTSDTYSGVAFFNLHKACDPFDPQIDSYAAHQGVLRRVTYPYAVCHTIDACRSHPALLGVMRSLLGDDVNQLVNQINFNPPGLGLGWGWHQDYRFRRPGLQNSLLNYVQCLIAIDPCNVETGGLRLIPESDRRGGLALDSNPENARQLLKDESYVTPSLAPGDAVIFNPYVIHGSTPNTSLHPRRVFINGYANANFCDYGRTVMAGGEALTGSQAMEYEDDPVRLAKASKY